MCGRYRIKDAEAFKRYLKEQFGIDVADFAARYNVAPSQVMQVITVDDAGNFVARKMRWGYVPFWEKNDKPRIAPINARAEEAMAKPMFRQSLERRRCLVPADGFYEWQVRAGLGKQPFDISVADSAPFFFAGIFEQGTVTRPDSYLLFTTKPNELMATIHDRMPAILTEENAKRWIQRGDITPEALAEFTAPYPARKMRARPISTLINSVKNDGPECIAGPDELF
jgi:putative SOS response-associated peptidase YedK